LLAATSTPFRRPAGFGSFLQRTKGKLYPRPIAIQDTICEPEAAGHRRWARSGCILRTKGEPSLLGHEDGRTTVVPVHSGETIGPGLLLKICAAPVQTPKKWR